MKKIVLCFALAMLLFFAMSVVVASEEYESENITDTDTYKELYQESGVDDIYKAIPEETKGFFKDNSITGIDSDKLMTLSFSDFLSTITGTIKDKLKSPLMVLVTSIGVILLCAVLNSIKSSSETKAYGKTFSVVSVVMLSAVIIVPISNLVLSVAKMIEQISGFLLTFVPVYCGIVAASGHPVTSATAGSFLMGAAQVTSTVSTTVLVPLVAIYMAICLVGPLSENLNTKAIGGAINNTVMTVMSFLLTIFVGLLGVQTTIAQATDTVSLRTAKFAANAFLPVVGGAVSEALNSIEGCMSIIKSTVGGFSIIAVFVMFLPTIISLLLTKLSISISSAVADTLGVDKISNLLQSIGKVLTLLLSIMLVFLVLTIVCIGLVMALAKGG